MTEQSQASPSASPVALVFPGQGCQFVGMGADLCQAFPQAQEMYDRADDILGFPVSALCFNGPAEELNDTANTQPAIYVTNMVLWACLRAEIESSSLLPRIAFAAGHSLGEFSALAAAGGITFEDGLRLVRRRGEAMRDAGEAAPGGMAAIIGLSDEAVEGVVRQAAKEDGSGVWAANYNSPGQVIIAGEQAALERAVELAKEQGAKRALPLQVSVACHTPLMAAASERLAAALEETAFSRPWVPIVSNVEALPLQEPEAIKAALLRQLSSPVRWVESVGLMVDRGATTMIEVGPRSVLAGLIKRIDRSVALHTVTDKDSLQSFDALDI